MEGEPRDVERLLAEMRPELHRYCARMVGSVVDGEDVVQDTLMKAYAARDSIGSLDNPRAWLFRVAHNTALDFLRRSARVPIMETEGELDVVPAPERPDPDIVSASLRSFMRLPTLQRASVILKDVLDHSLDEVASICGATEASAKSALQRGRERLRLIAREPEDTPLPTLGTEDRARLEAYVAGFQTHDFDAVRAMLAEDVRLDLVAHFKQRGKRDVGGYFTKYAEAEHWAYAPGILDGRPAMLVYDRRVSLDEPAYFVALQFDGGRVSGIRDFLFARYAMEAADLRRID
jgi:RNA polymerase sigma-70 factor (ECF subfamily)